MGVNKMASVGCSPLSESDAANGTVVTKRQQLKQQRDKQRQQEFQQEKRCAARWLPLVQGVLRKDIMRKFLDVCVALGRFHLARVEIGIVLWRAWTHRSLTLSGPRQPAWLGPLRGKALEPLSHRDMWVLGRAARLARLANIPFSGLQRRHVVHWLRIPMDEQCVDSDTDDEEGLSDEDWSDLEGPSDEEWCRTAPAHLVPSNDELARRAARYMPGGDMYEPGT